MNNVNLLDAPLTEKEYVNLNGRRCPACASHHLESGASGFNTDSVDAPVRCLDCGSKWMDVFTLTSYDSLEVRKG